MNFELIKLEGLQVCLFKHLKIKLRNGYLNKDHNKELRTTLCQWKMQWIVEIQEMSNWIIKANNITKEHFSECLKGLDG